MRAQAAGFSGRKIMAVLASAGVIAAVVLAVTPPSAFAMDGTITRAHATPSWTHASVAGSVVFDDCALVPCGSWQAYAYATSLADDENEGCQPYLNNEYVKTIWETPLQTTDGTASFAFKKVPIVRGIVGQRLCIHVTTTQSVCDGPFVYQCGADYYLTGRHFTGRNPCKQKTRSGGAQFAYGGDLVDGQVGTFELADPDFKVNVAAEFEPSAAVPKPSNTFTLGKTKRNQKKGTATITVKVPNPGKLTGSGSGVSAAGAAVISKPVDAGQAQLLIKAKGKKKRKLNDTGKVTLNVAITFTPTGGDPRTKSVKVKLKKNL